MHDFQTIGIEVTAAHTTVLAASKELITYRVTDETQQIIEQTEIRIPVTAIQCSIVKEPSRKLCETFTVTIPDRQESGE